MFDHIHRPKTDWKMLLMVVLFSIAGIVIQYITGVLDISPDRLGNQCLYTVIGLLAMFGIYFLDYSFIGKHAKLVYWGMIVVYFLYTNLWAENVYGQARGMVMPSYLFVPVYAGVLYQYRGQSYKALVKSILYMIPALFFSYCFIPSMPTAINLLVIMSCMLLVAIRKGWFKLNKIRTIVSLFMVGIVFPICALTYLYYFKMADYQRFRIQSVFHILDGTNESSFINRCANTMITDSKWIGAGCGLIFLVAIIEGVFMNFGLFPCTTIHIPFLTYGGSATIYYDSLLGLMLSVYRYQNVISDKIFKPRWKLSLKLEKTMRE